MGSLTSTGLLVGGDKSSQNCLSTSDGFCSSGPLEIQLVAMPQQAMARAPEEDWTGVSDPLLRRKLQNRINQRARSGFSSPLPAQTAVWRLQILRSYY